MSKDVKRMFLEEAEYFTRAIKSCRNSRAYGPDSLSTPDALPYVNNMRVMECIFFI